MRKTDDEYGTYEWLRSHRVGLGPFYIAVPIAALAVGLRFTESGAGLLIVGALAAAAAFWARRARGWRRPYYLIAIGVATAWVLAVDHTPVDAMWLAAAWLGLTVGLAMPWWTDRVRRTQVTMETTIRNWPIRAERIRLRGTWIKGMRGTDTGWSAKLTWLPGAYTVEEVQARRAQIEGALGLRAGELRMPEDGRSTNSICLVAVTDDPHARGVLWDIPTDQVGDQHVLKTLSVTEEFWIGVREDGKRKMFRLFVPGWGARQVLIGGMKGSGKSGLLNLLWAYLALCRLNVIQWGIDLKGGVELGPWQRVFDWTVETREAAWAMLRAATAEMERRQAYMKARGWKNWKVDEKHPLLVISIDEAASLLGNNARASELELFADLARKGRACGIALIIATQYPTLEALGSSQIREQIDQRFCFRMASSSGEDFVIPDFTVDAHKIPADRPGTCYHQDGEQLDRMPMRVLHVDDRDDENVITQLVSLLAGFTPTLDENATATVLAVAPEYGEREIAIPTQRDGDETLVRDPNETEERDDIEIDLTPDAQNVSLEALAEARRADLGESERAEEERLLAEIADDTERLGTAEALERLVERMRSTPDAVRVDDLIGPTTRSRSWCYDRLREMEAEGKVRRSENGWRWVVPADYSA